MALLLASVSAVSLILPPLTTPPAIVRPAPISTTSALAGLFGDEPKNVYKGDASSLDLGSLLDSVPADAGGKKGVERDQKGLERLKERQGEAEQLSKEKYEAVLAAEALGKEVSFQNDVKESANAGIAAANALFSR